MLPATSTPVWPGVWSASSDASAVNLLGCRAYMWFSNAPNEQTGVAHMSLLLAVHFHQVVHEHEHLYIC